MSVKEPYEWPVGTNSVINCTECESLISTHETFEVGNLAFCDQSCADAYRARQARLHRPNGNDEEDEEDEVIRIPTFKLWG